MKDRIHDISLRAVKVVNVVLMTVCFALVWYLYYSKTTFVPYHFRGSIAIIGLFVAVYVLMGKVYDAFLISYYPLSQVIYNQILAVFMADGVMFIAQRNPYMGLVALQLTEFPVQRPAVRHDPEGSLNDPPL